MTRAQRIEEAAKLANSLLDYVSARAAGSVWPPTLPRIRDSLRSALALPEDEPAPRSYEDALDEVEVRLVALGTNMHGRKLAVAEALAIVRELRRAPAPSAPTTARESLWDEIEAAPTTGGAATDEGDDRALPCGCTECVCADDEQCHGCGAKFCTEHAPASPVDSPDPWPPIRVKVGAADTQSSGRVDPVEAAKPCPCGAPAHRWHKSTPKCDHMRASPVESAAPATGGVCDECEGSGIVSGGASPTKCDVCGGTGRVGGDHG
jgi:hypothetical protein